MILSTIPATIRAEELANNTWDAVIIGSGPAGAFAAYQLACFSKKVLLLDKAHFPRAKVCGCCINDSAAQALKDAGLGYLLIANGSVPLAHLKVFDGKTSTAIKLPGGHALSRNRLDAALIDAAIRKGSAFMPGAVAHVLENSDATRLVQVEVGSLATKISTKIVIVADGLNGRALAGHHEFDVIIEGASRFGSGTIIESNDPFYCAGNVYMACSDHGYVGLVRLEDGRIDVAAALSKEFSRAQAGPGLAAKAILQHCDMPVPAALETAHWTGTEALTRKRPKLAGERLFVIGDSCGYPEPFTGEGIAWALWSATAVTPLAVEGISKWHPDLVGTWQRTHNLRIGSRHSRSKIIAVALTNKTVRRVGLPILSAFPFLATPVINLINSPPTIRNTLAIVRTTGSYATKHSEAKGGMYARSEAFRRAQEPAPQATERILKEL